MKPAVYAEALYDLARDKSDAELDRIVAHTLALLTERGHRALLPAIVHELLLLTRKRHAARALEVRVARQTDADQFQNSIRADAATLGATDAPARITVDPLALGGYEVRAQGKRIDRTYKRSLVDLYQNLISSS